MVSRTVGCEDLGDGNSFFIAYVRPGSPLCELYRVQLSRNMSPEFCSVHESGQSETERIGIALPRMELCKTHRYIDIVQ